MQVTINTPAVPARAVQIRDEAAEDVRMAFNPSGREDVDTLKALAAAFVSECERLAEKNMDAGRELAVAKTWMQTASMWAVLGATKGA